MKTKTRKNSLGLRIAGDCCAQEKVRYVATRIDTAVSRKVRIAEVAAQGRVVEAVRSLFGKGPAFQVIEHLKKVTKT